MCLPSSSSESIARDEPRFQRKLRNGLFERVRERRPIFNEPPLLDVNGSVEDNGVDRRWSESMMSRAITHAHAGVQSGIQFVIQRCGVGGHRASERAYAVGFILFLSNFSILVFVLFCFLFD